MKSNSIVIALYKKLRCNVKGHVTHFRSDWRVDRMMMRSKKLERFVHVSKPTGTHMYKLHLDLHTDTALYKYLFSHATKLQQMVGIKGVIASLAKRSDTVFQYYDGQTLEVVTGEQAETVLDKLIYRRR